MKKLALFFIVLASIVVLFTCNVALAQTVISCGTPEEVTLYAGQTIDVGTITAYNDSDNLYVKYTTTGGWVLDETHLAVATSLDDIPQKKGNPLVSHFPYKLVHLSVTEYVYVINLEEAGYTVDTELYIAAHADVSLIDDYGNIVQEEGAWGSGNNFPGKNWATFFTYSVQLGNQALLGGGLSKAEVRAYRLSDLKNPIEGPVVTSESSIDISGAGLFSLQLSGLPEDEYILLAVSNGKDTDADGDGVPDSEPTSNMGTIYALVTVSELNDHGIRISAITDIAWQFVRNLVGEVNDNGLQTRLNDIAQILFREDINGDGLINSQDISAFFPLDNTHKQKLNFEYQNLFARDEKGNSIIGSYHTGQENILLDLLKNAFGIKLTLYPDRDFRNKAVKLEVLGFGRGSFRSNVGGIDFDSERTSGENTNHDFYDPDKTDAVTITAVPIPETEILGWNGCDVVSKDMTQCQCVLARDRNRQVRVSFGYKETKVVPNLVDLSRTEVIRNNYTLLVTVGHGDDEMVATMADLSEDDYVVGFADRGFLLKVLTVNKISDYKYTLTTDEASLEEVIQQGTGVLTKQMTHGDLVNNVNSGQEYLSHSTKAMLTTNYEAAIAGPTPATPIEPDVEFSAIDGVRLLPSDNPEEKTFTIQIGRLTSDVVAGPKFMNKSSQLNAMNTEDHLWEDVVIWDNENGVQVKVNGTIDLEILLDVGVSYGIISGLEDFRFVPTVKATENITLTITGKFEDNLDDVEIAPIRFGHLSFFIGPVPVWITFQLDVSVGGNIKVTAEATTGVDLEQTITAGVHYQKSTGGFHPVKNFRKSWTFDEPNIEAELYAKTFVKSTGKVLFYSKTGPSVFIEPYLELKGQLADNDTLLQRSS